MDHPDFRIATPDGKGRIFATLSAEVNGKGVLKLTVEQQQAFMEELPEVFEPVQGGWGRMGMTYVHLDRAEEDLLLGALTMAHRNVAAKLEANKPKPAPRKKRKPVPRADETEMNRDQTQIERRSARRPKYWARGMHFAKQLGIENEAELLKFCVDPQGDASARGIACLALGYFEYRPAVPVLVKLADDANLSLVVNATRALSVIGSLRAVRPMLSLAKGATRVEVRNRAIDVLGMLGDRRAEETLVAILSNRSVPESTRVCAADALAGLRPRSDAPIACLLGVLKEDSALLRWTALNSLGIMGDRNTIPAIQACLVDQESVHRVSSEETVASAAENALRNLQACAQPKKSAKP
jgi:hypothetical protein